MNLQNKPTDEMEVIELDYWEGIDPMLFLMLGAAFLIVIFSIIGGILK